MFSLTRQEKLIIIFLGLSILIGVILEICGNVGLGLKEIFCNEVIKSQDNNPKINISLVGK
jgi:hypothetical protein